ncbi:MAG: O-antigen ligase family protein [Planctomycetia bacterium]|nr:O-antigen ligase family protein [Planctomycetia bacterium]
MQASVDHPLTSTFPIAATSSPVRGHVLLWLSAIVIAAAFFFGTHDPLISLAQDYLPSEADLELAAGGGSLFRMLSFPSIAALGLLLVALSDRRARGGDRLLAGAALFYLAWCATSTVWSAEPGLSFRRFMVVGFTLIGAWGVARALSLRSLCMLVVIITTAFTAIGVVTELSLGTFTPWAADYRFAGTTHPNAQSDFAACLTLAALCLATEKSRLRPLWIALACVGLGSLVLADSRTTTAALLTALFAAWAVRRPMKIAAFAVAAIVWLASSVLLLSLMGGSDVEQAVVDRVLLTRSEEPFSLNGRVPLWNELLPYAFEHPVLGYGYDGFWNIDRTDAVAETLEWPMAEAHSAYLETMLGVGLVGLAAFLTAAWLAIKDSAVAYRATHDAGHAFLFALMVYCAISASMESGVSKPTFLAFVLACGIWNLVLFPSAAAATPATSVTPQKRAGDS